MDNSCVVTLDSPQWHFDTNALDSLRSITDPHDGEDPNDPSTVQAMAIVLYLPKNGDGQDVSVDEALSREHLLSAAAVASLAVCLDPRAGTESEWRQSLHNWYGARIRKITRRARKKGQWEAIQDVPGITAQVGRAAARAFVPTPVGDVDHRVGRLQIEGTDVSHSVGEHIASGPVIITNGRWPMSVGKLAAQVGHAAMLWAANASAGAVVQWVRQPAFRVVELSAEEFSARHETFKNGAYVVDVKDAGYTEVDPGAITAAAVITASDEAL